MKNVFKNIFIINLLLLGTVFSQNINEIQTIRTQFNKWQKAIADSLFEKKEIFHLYFGENFNEDIWVENTNNKNDKFIGEEISVLINDSLGMMFRMREYTPSGDWSVYSEHYYLKTGRLFFIFWSLNTFYSDEPLTVEKRLYFDEKGNIIKQLEYDYKINTKIKVNNPNFMDREVLYWDNIDKLPFKKYLND